MKDNNQQMTMERQFQPMSAAQLKEQALRARMIDDAPTPCEKERLREEFAEWNKQGKPITEDIAERARKMREAWQSELSILATACCLTALVLSRRSATRA